MRKIIMLLLCTTFILYNSFIIHAETRYDLEDDFREAGYIIGQFEGYSDGFVYSIGNNVSEEKLAAYLEEVGEDLDPDYEDYFPDETLKREEREEFEEGFIEGYKSGFTDGYNGTQLIVDYELQDYEALGQQYGAGYGNSMAVRDYEARLSKDAERAYKEFESRENVYKMLDMHIIGQEDANSMLRVIEDSFKSAYNAYYDNLYINEIGQEGSYLNLFLSPISFSYSESTSQVVNKGASIIGMPGISIQAEEFTFYEEAFLRISKTVRNQFMPVDNKKMMTDLYELTIFNKVNPTTPTSANATKEFQISFNGVGNDRAGIYKMSNGVWTYQYTEFEENQLVHNISKGDYNGGVYAVLIDFDYPLFKGINLSWAYEELYTYLRREYLFLDDENNYDPTKEITRKEFAYLISKNSYDADYFSYENKVFDDKNEFGKYMSSINYCYNKGYLVGISETEFGPNDPINFEQVEIVMQRVLKNNFQYSTISDDMMNEKYKKSAYLTGKNQNITRDEAVYMFYSLFR